MNEIKIYLKPSGSTAELYKDFNLYQGSYRNVEITVYVPTALLYKNADNTFFSTVQTGAILTAQNGAKIPTKSFNAEFVKTVIIGGVEYAEYTQIMPKEYVLYAGTQIIVCNVVNIDNTDATAPKIISVTTSQRAPFVVQESAYLSEDEPLDPSEAEVIEGLINDLQERLNNGTFAARAIYAYNSSYTYGAGELVFYPYKGDYGAFLKSLVADNKTEPYDADGVLNAEAWEEITDFNILNELYGLKGDVEQAVADAQGSATSAAQSASASAVSSASAAQSARNAESAAQRIEAEAEYIESVKAGTVAVPKAVADEAGNNIANQFGVVTSDIAGLREDINNEAHFRGMFDSVDALREKYPTATPNDYAYVVGGNIWIYEEDGGWTDSGEPSPNTAVPASDAIPLMDGKGSAGTLAQYSRGDHRHDTDTSRASAVDLENEITARKTADATLTEISNKNLYNLGAFDTYASNGDGTATITRKTGYVRLDGSEDWFMQKAYSATPDYRAAFKEGAQGITNLQTNANKCYKANSLLSTATGTWGVDGFVEGVAVGADKWIYYYSPNFNTADSLSAFKEWLSKNPITLQYETETSYTETVIENQPIHTLNQEGEQWLREEWEKGLNKFRFNNVSFTKNGLSFVCSQDGTIAVNGTSTSITNLYPTNTELGTPINFSSGSYTCSVEQTGSGALSYIRFTDDTENYNIGPSASVSFTFTKSFYASLIQLAAGTYSNYVIKIMLNEGNHAYPYEPYYGGIVREKDFALAYSPNNPPPLYQHSISIVSQDRTIYVTANILSRDSTPFTFATLKSYLQNNGLTAYFKGLSASGTGFQNATTYTLFALAYYTAQQVVGALYYVSTGATGILLISDTDTFNDVVVKI